MYIADRVHNSISRIWLPAVVLGGWVATSGAFLEDYVSVVQNADDPLIAIGASLAIAWINFAALFAAYHMVSFLSSVCVRRSRRTISLDDTDHSPPVALFYLCMNDFNESAFRSCIDLDYTHCHIFVLDDSTNPKEIQRVDEIVGAYQERAHVIRRSNRNGFKAGSLNHGISTIGNTHFVYYCIVDADERLPRSFLKRAVAIAERDSLLGFVQAAHTTYGETAVGGLLGGGLKTHWNYFLPARNYTGFQCFIGHGALLRASAVRAVDGFNHVVAEDLDIATRIRMRGYKGYFDFETECSEASPPTHHAFRRRGEKVVTGTLEFLLRSYPRFVRCRDVSIGEKLDVFMSVGVVLLPAMFVGILTMEFFILPALHMLINDPAVVYDEALRRALLPLDRPGFMLMVLFTVVTPAIYTIPDLVARPVPNMRAIARLGTAHLSINMTLAIRTIIWLCKKDQRFVPTGDRYAQNTICMESCIGLILAVYFFVIGITACSTCLMVIGGSALYVPVILRSKLEHSLVDMLMCIPFVIAIPASFIDPFSAAIGAGICSSIACIYH